MANFPPNSASRRPESSWPPPEDEDFRIVPPPGVSAPPPGVSVPPPQAAPPPVQRYAPPPPPPVVVTPAPVRQPARPATTAAPNRQRLYIALGAGAILLLAIAFFVYFELAMNPSSSRLAAVATVSVVNPATAIPGCNQLNGTGPTPGPNDANLFAQTLYHCGMYQVRFRISNNADDISQAVADVKNAQGLFVRANQLAASKVYSDQITFTNLYLLANNACVDQHLGSCVDLFGALVKQDQAFMQTPTADPVAQGIIKSPYADSVSRYYKGLMDSGLGQLQAKNCPAAKERFQEAETLRQYVNIQSALDALQQVDNPKNCSP